MTSHSNFDLFDTPISRNTDPDTSKRADTKYSLGRRAVRQWQVLNLVFNYPNHTCGEYARLFVLRHPEMPICAAAETPHKRMSDLHKKGLVERRPPRKCRDSGELAHVWRITDAGIRELE